LAAILHWAIFSLQHHPISAILKEQLSGYPVNSATMFCGNPPRLALLATPPGRGFWCNSHPGRG